MNEACDPDLHAKRVSKSPGTARARASRARSPKDGKTICYGRASIFR